MNRTAKSGTAVSMAMCLMLAGCATTGSQPLTAQQKVVRCAGIVAAGAVLGGVIGNNTGKGDAKQGVTIGALAGGATCAVWLAFENEADKRRMVEAQLAAATRGEVVQDTWTGEDGRARTVTVTPSTETQMVVASVEGTPEPDVTPRLCRRMNTDASVAGQSDAIGEVWCRGDDGTYAPASTPMVDSV